MTALLVAIGGGLGALCRYGTGIAVLRLFGPGFPIATILVNIVGSLAMGLLIGWMAKSGVSANSTRLFWATGFLGGFTTFSAFSLDFAVMWERQAYQQAAVYAGGSVVLSLAAVFIGLWLARLA
jgi:CrcB protein